MPLPKGFDRKHFTRQVDNTKYYHSSSQLKHFFRMRDIKASYNQLLKLKDKQETFIKKLEKENLLNEELQRNILAVRSSDELEHLVFHFLNYTL